MGVTGLWTVSGTKIISSSGDGTPKACFYWKNVGLQCRLL